MWHSVLTDSLLRHVDDRCTWQLVHCLVSLTHFVVGKVYHHAGRFSNLARPVCLTREAGRRNWRLLAGCHGIHHLQCSILPIGWNKERVSIPKSLWPISTEYNITLLYNSGKGTTMWICTRDKPPHTPIDSVISHLTWILVFSFRGILLSPLNRICCKTMQLN